MRYMYASFHQKIALRMDWTPRFLSEESPHHKSGEDIIDEHAREEACGINYNGTQGIVVIACALLAGVVSKMALSKTRLPYTVLLTVLGGIMGLVHEV